MRYTVRADSLNLRVAPSTTAAVIVRLPQGATVTTDLTVGRPDLPDRTGYDDPTTPQPARVSSDWVRVVAYQRSPATPPVRLRTPLYAAYEWVEPVRDAAGYPVE